MSEPHLLIIHRLRILLPAFGCRFSSAALAKDGFHAGPIFDQFSLTLVSGHRTEAVWAVFL